MPVTLHENQVLQPKPQVPLESFQWNQQQHPEQASNPSINLTNTISCRNSVQGKTLIADDKGEKVYCRFSINHFCCSLCSHCYIITIYLHTPYFFSQVTCAVGQQWSQEVVVTQRIPIPSVTCVNRAPSTDVVLSMNIVCLAVFCPKRCGNEIHFMDFESCTFINKDTYKIAINVFQH